MALTVSSFATPLCKFEDKMETTKQLYRATSLALGPFVVYLVRLINVAGCSTSDMLCGTQWMLLLRTWMMISFVTLTVGWARVAMVVYQKQEVKIDGGSGQLNRENDMTWKEDALEEDLIKAAVKPKPKGRKALQKKKRF